MKTPWMRAFEARANDAPAARDHGSRGDLASPPLPLPLPLPLPRKGTRGAVYVEFLVVFLPLLSLFLGLVQLAFLQAASIIVQHSAMRAVRTAGVILYDNPKFYNNEGQGSVGSTKRKIVEDDARIPLTTLGDASKATITWNANGYDRDDPVTLTVLFDYSCRVPLGRILACGADGEKQLAGEATLPTQGADFDYYGGP